MDDVIRISDTKKGTSSGFKENINFHKVYKFSRSVQCKIFFGYIPRT